MSPEVLLSPALLLVIMKKVIRIPSSCSSSRLHVSELTVEFLPFVFSFPVMFLSKHKYFLKNLERVQVRVQYALSSY